MRALEEAIRSVPGVLDVHDIHVWSVGSGLVAGSCQILMAKQTVQVGHGVMEAVREVIHEGFHVTHPTV